jgi:hypothetical protein
MYFSVKRCIQLHKLTLFIPNLSIHTKWFFLFCNSIHILYLPRLTIPFLHTLADPAPLICLPYINFLFFNSIISFVLSMYFTFLHRLTLPSSTLLQQPPSIHLQYTFTVYWYTYSNIPYLPSIHKPAVTSSIHLKTFPPYTYLACLSYISLSILHTLTSIQWKYLPSICLLFIHSITYLYMPTFYSLYTLFEICPEN